jgi:hypothetical protein
MARKSVAVIVAIAGSLAVVPAALGVQGERRPPGKEGAYEAAREEAGKLAPVQTRVELTVGTLRLAEPELVAANFGQQIEFTFTLARDVDRGTLRVGLPSRWTARSVSGLRPTRAPRIDRRSQGVSLGAATDAVVLALDGARSGAVTEFSVQDRGIPAGEYSLPVTYTGAGGRTASLGSIGVRLLAPARETREAENPFAGLKITNNITDDASTESESFVSVTPGNPQRILAGVNGGGGYNAWISTDGGDSWAKRAVPAAANAPGDTAETMNLCCDPMSAADAAGNLWYGGLSLANGGSNPSRIFVSRIAAGTDTFVGTAALAKRTSGTQDKPMMTIDNTPSSPTFGRLYVVWDEPSGGGINLVGVYCDTRPGGTPNAANCDDADSWSAVIDITGLTGSYIYADVAVDGAGKVYVTWWDYSANNAIRGRVCNGVLAACSSTQTIATLDATGGAPIPFACPILAQPGGRAAPSPSVEVASSDGRVYVTWGDLRAGSGTTRCDDNNIDALPTNMTWDSYVGAATDTLPGPGPGTTVGTKLLSDGEGGGDANSDEWFPWIAVDQTTGRAFADFYSTRDDSSGLTTQFYVRSVSPDLDIGPLTQVSANASDYSANQCCGFGNDYGDYTGIDATSGTVFPVWSDKSTSDGELFIASLTPGAAPVAAISGPDSATTGSPVAFDASASTAGGSITAYDWDLDGNGSFETATAGVATVSTTFAAAGTYGVKVRVTDDGAQTDTATKTITVSDAPPPPPPTQTTTETTPPPPPPFGRLGKSASRVRKGAFTFSLSGCAACSGTLVIDSAKKFKGKRVRIARVRFAIGPSGTAKLKVKLSRAGAKLLKRLRRVPVVLTLTVGDATGATASTTGRLTLRR